MSRDLPDVGLSASRVNDNARRRIIHARLPAADSRASLSRSDLIGRSYAPVFNGETAVDPEKVSIKNEVSAVRIRTNECAPIWAGVVGVVSIGSPRRLSRACDTDDGCRANLLQIACIGRRAIGCISSRRHECRGDIRSHTDGHGLFCCDRRAVEPRRCLDSPDLKRRSSEIERKYFAVSISRIAHRGNRQCQHVTSDGDLCDIRYRDTHELLDLLNVLGHIDGARQEVSTEKWVRSLCACRAL